MTIDIASLGILGALSAARVGMVERELHLLLVRSGIAASDGKRALASLLERGAVVREGGMLTLTNHGVRSFLDAHAAIEAALDNSPTTKDQEECPSLPWLTTVQTHWIDAVSINYAVDPAALARILPAPIEPEIWKGTAWVQVLMSSLRDMRPQGLGALFGVCFYQIAYRAAIRFRGASGEWRRGGYFIRSETNHEVMRTVGNALTEFKFHDFGMADMVMLRDGDRLTLGVDPEGHRPGGKVVAVVDTRPLAAPPAGSVWGSIDELHEPLVECFDALGVDRENHWLYVLTIDRDPWNPHFVKPEEIYVELFDGGALGGGVARYDSTLHFRECGYRWRPLRRERLA